MRPVRLTYGDVDDEEKLEKDRTLMLRPIVTDRTRLVATGTLLETIGRWGCYIWSICAAASGHHLTIEIK